MSTRLLVCCNRCSFTMADVPLQEPKRWMNLYKESAPDVSHQLYWAAISHLDDAVGQVIAQVDRIGQRDNTVVIFISDNGAPGQPNRMQVRADHDAYLNVTLPGDNLPFRGKEGDVYEGGIRTPVSVFWPTHLKPRICEAPLHVTDWMPTLCAFVGHQPERDLKWDGRDVWPIISGTQSSDMARSFYTKGSPRKGESALRQADWKLIRRKNGTELFHLADDAGESANCAAGKPELVRRLHTLLEAETDKDNDARPNPNQ